MGLSFTSFCTRAPLIFLLWPLLIVYLALKIIVAKMFGLIYGLWEYLFRQEELNVLLVGVDKAGKTTLLEKLKSLYNPPGLEPDKILPTVGLNVGRMQVAVPPPPVANKASLPTPLHSLGSLYTCYVVVTCNNPGTRLKQLEGPIFAKNKDKAA
jgi:ADP-ribosylation factor family